MCSTCARRIGSYLLRRAGTSPFLPFLNSGLLAFNNMKVTATIGTSENPPNQWWMEQDGKEHSVWQHIFCWMLLALQQLCTIIVLPLAPLFLLSLLSLMPFHKKVEESSPPSLSLSSCSSLVCSCGVLNYCF